MAVCGLISLSTTELASPGSHLFEAVHAHNVHDVYLLRGQDGLTTAGADVLAGTAGLLGLRLFIVTEGSGAGDGQLIAPMLGGTKGPEDRGWLDDGVANLGGIVNQQAPLLCLLLEARCIV